MDELKILYVGTLPGNKSEEVLEVDSEMDYLSAVQYLETRATSPVREVWVRHKYLYFWLKQYAELCGLHPERIQFKEVTARELLRQRWNLEIPGWLANECIIKEGLLAQSLPNGAQNVEIGILAQIIPQFNSVQPTNFSATMAADLVEQLNRPGIIAEMSHGIYSLAWQALCEQWKESPVQPWVVKFVDRLQKNPARLWAELSTWAILHRYPKQLHGFAFDQGSLQFLKMIPSDMVKGMKLCPKGTGVAIDQITHYAEEVIKSNPDVEDVEALLTQVSGEIIQEFRLLERIFDVVPNALTQKSIAKLQSLFEGLDLRKDISRLKSKIQPPIPRKIAEDADEDEWLDWAVKEYIPYRHWQLKVNEFDRELEKTVLRFTQWYTDNYRNIHAKAEFSAIQGISQWKESIEKDDFSLLVLIDNLPYFFVPIFNDAMRTEGFFLHQQKPRFVPLPSMTSVSKPLLLSGGTHSAGSDYKKLLKQRSKDEWNGRDVQYFSSLHALTQSEQITLPTVAILNYLEADEWLHSDSRKSGITEEEQLGLLFQKLAEGARSICRRMLEAGKKVGVYVLSDHGSTRLLPEERQAVESHFSNKLFANEKYRSASMNQEQAASIPDNLWSLGKRFEDSFNPEQIHFIPMGHNTVGSHVSEGAYSHGGATPEEVLVPFALYRLVRPNMPAPAIRLLEPELTGSVHKWYIKRVVEIAVELQNRANAECLLYQVELHPNIGEVRHFDGVSLAAMNKGTTRISLYFDQRALAVSELKLTLQSKFGEDTLSTVLTLPVKITSAVSGGINLRDL